MNQDSPYLIKHAGATFNSHQPQSFYDRKRTKRLRKKLKVDEFTDLGYAIKFSGDFESNDIFDEWYDAVSDALVIGTTTVDVEEVSGEYYQHPSSLSFGFMGASVGKEEPPHASGIIVIEYSPRVTTLDYVSNTTYLLISQHLTKVDYTTFVFDINQ